MNLDHFKKPSKLDINAARPDVCRDLHLFVAYVRDRDVKRGHRNNSLSKTDMMRMAKLFSDPIAESEVQKDGYSTWIAFIDRLAYRLGLVHYNTQGEYAGYSSSSPCFPDNYIEFDEKAYEKLISTPIARQEKQRLELLIEGDQGNASEFFHAQLLGRLEGFSQRGSALGVVPKLDFTAVRRSLLNLLARCPAGEWLSVASLVEYLKKNDRYFLIPKKPQFRHERDRTMGRYGNFRESKDAWGNEIEINEKDPDAFERVEGRYIERFLEGIPYLLGYVDVAYAKLRPKSVYPTRGYLQAFRVSDRLSRALEGKIAEPTLRVTPSFELYVQSEFYPARLLGALLPICDVVSEHAATVLRLDRRKVAAACAADSKLDVTRLLESFSTETLPANVRRELLDWSAQSEKFILYSGCSLLETNGQVAGIERFRVENIAVGIDLVRSPSQLYEQLEEQQLVPLRIKHGEKSFTPLPPKTRSVFPRQGAAKKNSRVPKTKVTLTRVTRVQLLCKNREFLDRLQRLLAAASCPVEADRKQLLLAYSRQYEKEVSRAIHSLRNDFEVKIKDQ